MKTAILSILLKIRMRPRKGSPASQTVLIEKGDDMTQHGTFRWEGTEDDLFREADKACKARCKEDGEDGCPREDHRCDECETDAKWALRVKKPATRRKKTPQRI